MSSYKSILVFWTFLFFDILLIFLGITQIEYHSEHT